MNEPRVSARRRWAWRILIAAGAAVLIAWQAPRFFPNQGHSDAALPVPMTSELVARGKYLARVGDCVACHTAPGGPDFAGGLPMASPVGTIYSTNITPDPDTGIGEYSYGDFERAVRRGLAKSGHPLYPAMPYPSYARVTNEDIAALYAYFKSGVKAVRRPNQSSDIPWPLSIRWPLQYWRLSFSPSPERFEPVPVGASPAERGAYLVEGLGHCGACHTPRAITLQEKALNNSRSDFLGGSLVDHWVAPSLRGEAVSGLGEMSSQDIVTLLQCGRTDSSAAFGGMAEVVQHSTQYMTEQDLQAMAVYLKSLAPARQETPREDPKTAADLFAGTVSRPGAQLYLDNCATCHRTAGQGYAGVFPALAANPAVNSDDPTSLIHLVISGGIMPATNAAPTQFAMPAFGNRLSDQDVAEVTSFIRTSWGNAAPPVTAAKVARVRTALPEPKAPEGLFDPRARMGER